MLFLVVCSFAQFTTSSTPVNPYCIGNTNGSIKFTASAGVAPYTVQMTSPTMGSVITMSGSPASYTYTGLAAGVYAFTITDNNGSTVNRNITLTNPIPFSFTNFAFIRSIGVATCDSIDLTFSHYNNGGLLRPNFKYEFWINVPTSNTNGSVPATSPTITYNRTLNGGSFRLPITSANTITVARVTDSCGNTLAANITTLPSIASTSTNSTSVCSAVDLRILYGSLSLPITFTLDSNGVTKQTLTQISVVTGSNSLYSGGTMQSVLPGTYTLKAVDNCGVPVTKTVTVVLPTKSIPSAAASNACGNTSVDSTASFRILSGSWSLPATLTIVSGPATYAHSNIAGVINPNISYPMSRNVPLGSNFVDLINMPMGTYRIAVLDACGWADTVTYVVDASNIAKINLAATLTPGCLDANTVTVTGDFSCFRPETNITLKNSAGAIVGSSGVTGSLLSFSIFNLPSGNYTINLTGVFTGNSILTHISSGSPSMVIPISFTSYAGPKVSIILRSPCPNSTVGSLVTRALGVPPYSYELLEPLNNNVLRTSQTDSVFNSVNLSDSFRVRVTDACGNISVSSIASFAGVIRNVGVSTSSVSCIPVGNLATFRADSIDATNYQWTGANGFVANGRVVTKTISSYADSGTYKVVSTNIAGCKDSATVNLTVKPNAGVNQTVCQNTIATLTAQPTTAGVWSARSGNPSAVTITTPNNTTTTVTGLSVAGTYNFIWTAYTGCTDTVAVTVNALPTVAAITGTSIITIGSTATIANTTSGGVWSSLNTNIATIGSTGIVTGVVAGAATINYKVTAANSCSNTASYNITVNPKANP